MNKIYLLFAALFLTISAWSQTASVQVIHNSPTPNTDAGPVVDIYVNGDLLPELTGVPFRAATKFLDVPAGADIEVAVAVNPSTSVEDAIETFPLGQLNDGESYVVIANGIVGDMANPFDLEVKAMAKQAADDSETVEFIVFHGSPNAPAVDVDARTVGTLVDNLAFGEFTADYTPVPPALYYLDVRAAGDPGIIATFAADLSGLAGGAATVFASGFLGVTPSFGLFAALPDGTVVTLPAAEVARLQVIHNSPTPTVDIYANGDILIPDFEFRSATEFIFVPAGVNIDLAVALGDSESAEDALTTIPVQFENGSTYVAVANGIVGDTDTPFALEVNDMAREAAADGESVDLSVFHGSPDAPAVDVDARTVGEIVDSLNFGEFTDEYITVPAGLYYLDVRVANDPDIAATFAADVSGLAGGAATVFASGFLGEAPAFGLFAALPNGDVLELPAAEVARLQVIHNSPTPTVDIYANGDLLIPDFEFRTATGFIFVPAGVNIDLAVALGDSESAEDALTTIPVQFENGLTYVAIANGIVGDMETPFEIRVNDMGQEAAADGESVDLLAFHGSPGAPNVDIDARLGGTLFGDLGYSEFDGYLPVPAGLYYLDVRATGSPDVVATFEANLTGLGGGAATVFASGFLGEDPAFGLFAALPDGTVLELPATGAARVQIIHASPSGTVDVYVNGSIFLDDFEYLNALPYIFLRSDTPYDFAIALADSESVEDAIYTLDGVTLEDRENYAVIAAGVVADGNFQLFTQAGVREFGTSMEELDLIAFHGISDAPAVDLAEFPFDETLVTNLSFGEFTDYFSGEAALSAYRLLPTGTEDKVGDFLINLTGGGGLAATVFATGTLGADDFNLYAALRNGAVLSFSPAARAQIIHNSPSDLASVVDVYLGDNLIIDDFAYQSANAVTYLSARVPITFGLAAADSESSEDVALTLGPVTFDMDKEYIVMAAGDPLDTGAPLDLYTFDGADFRVGAEEDNARVQVFHGGVDAPAVNVDARGVGNLVSDLSFGEYLEDYLSVPDGQYFLEVRANANDALVATFDSDLTGLGGVPVVVFASGLLAGNPDFDLLAALPNGTVVRLIPVAQAQVIHNSPTPTVDVYANGDILLPDFEFRTATEFVDLPTRVGIDLAVALGDSGSAEEAVFNLDDVVLEDGKVYIVMATGVVGDAATPFDLAINDMGQTRAASGEGVDLLLYHGSPDAPTVDVVAQGVGVVFDDVSYGEYEGYTNVPAGTYVLDVTPGDNNDTALKTYDADLTGLNGGAAVVFASGFFGSEDMEDAFQVWVALPDGTTFPLDEVVGINELANQVSDFLIMPNPVSSQATIQYTLTEELELNLNIYDMNGKMVRSQYMGSQAPDTYTNTVDVSNLPQGVYHYSMVSPKGVLTKRLVVTRR